MLKRVQHDRRGEFSMTEGSVQKKLRDYNQSAVILPSFWDDNNMLKANLLRAVGISIVPENNQITFFPVNGAVIINMGYCPESKSC